MRAASRWKWASTKGGVDEESGRVDLLARLAGEVVPYIDDFPVPAGEIDAASAVRELGPAYDEIEAHVTHLLAVAVRGDQLTSMRVALLPIRLHPPSPGPRISWPCAGKTRLWRVYRFRTSRGGRSSAGSNPKTRP